MRVGKLGGCNYLFIGSVKTPVTYIIHNCSGEQVYILKNYAKRMAQVVLLYVFNVNAVVGYNSVLYIIETVYKICYCGLSCSCSSNECNFLTGLGKQ